LERRDRIAAQLTKTAIHIPLPSSPPPKAALPPKPSTSETEKTGVPPLLTPQVIKTTYSVLPPPFIEYGEQDPFISPTESMASSKAKDDEHKTGLMSTNKCL
jgi:hypothetical protein